jgi:hypothetical protein
VATTQHSDPTAESHPSRAKTAIGSQVRWAIRTNGGGIILAVILIVVGGYYFLRNALGFDLGELDDQAVWPLVEIAMGAWILYRNLGTGGEQRP